jgi:hypothetical protein
LLFHVAVVVAVLMVHLPARADETCPRLFRLRTGLDLGMCLTNEQGVSPSSACSQTSIGLVLRLGDCDDPQPPAWQASLEGAAVARYTAPWRVEALLPRVVFSRRWDGIFFAGFGAQSRSDLASATIGVQGLLELGAPVCRLVEIGWRGAVGSAATPNATGDERNAFALDSTLFARMLVP